MWRVVRIKQEVVISASSLLGEEALLGEIGGDPCALPVEAAFLPASPPDLLGEMGGEPLPVGDGAPFLAQDGDKSAEPPLAGLPPGLRPLDESDFAAAAAMAFASAAPFSLAALACE